MKPKVQPLGAAIARERRDGGQVKLSTFIPMKIRKRGASKVVVRPDGAVESPGKVASQIDQPLLVALTRASTGNNCSTTAWSAVAARSRSGKACTTRRSTSCCGLRCWSLPSSRASWPGGSPGV